MTNEWEEFRSYLIPPAYHVEGKTDRRYLGRFTFEMFESKIGLSRVLTILARGYLFHDVDGGLLGSEPRDRLERAWLALCAWCSMPQEGRSVPEDERIHKPDFSELHGEFPELVDDYGRGWYYRHVHNVVDYTLSQPTRFMKTAVEACKRLADSFDDDWWATGIQMQIPPFKPTTKRQWLLSYTEVLSNALELGPLRIQGVELPPALLATLEQQRPEEFPKALNILPTLVAYYAANRQPDTDWVVLPVTSFNAYFGTTSFSKKYLDMIPEEILVRTPQSYGVSRYRVLPEFLP